MIDLSVACDYCGRPVEAEMSAVPKPERKWRVNSSRCSAALFLKSNKVNKQASARPFAIALYPLAYQFTLQHGQNCKD